MQRGHTFGVPLIRFDAALLRAGVHETESPENQKGVDDGAADNGENLPNPEPKSLSHSSVLSGDAGVLSSDAGVLQSEYCGFELSHELPLPFLVLVSHF